MEEQVHVCMYGMYVSIEGSVCRSGSIWSIDHMTHTYLDSHCLRSMHDHDHNDIVVIEYFCRLNECMTSRLSFRRFTYIDILII
jgi:hypothetical protein